MTRLTLPLAAALFLLPAPPRPAPACGPAKVYVTIDYPLPDSAPGLVFVAAGWTDPGRCLVVAWCHPAGDPESLYEGYTLSDGPEWEVGFVLPGPGRYVLLVYAESEGGVRGMTSVAFQVLS